MRAAGLSAAQPRIPRPRLALPQAPLRLAGRRLRARPGLVLAMLVGLLVAASLLAAVPLYAEGVATGALRAQLASSEATRGVVLRHAAGRTGSPLSLEQYRAADRFVHERAPSLLGLPVDLTPRFGQTDPLPILVAGSVGADYSAYGSLAFADDLPGHVDLPEGRWPSPSRSGDGAVEAAISTDGLDELGIKVGDTIQVVGTGSGPVPSLKVRIVGRWLPREETDPYWLKPVEQHRLSLFVAEESFFADVSSTFARVPREYSWGLIFDPTGLRAGEAGRVLDGLIDLRNEAQRAVRGLRVESAPDDLLEGYQRRVFFLEALLLAITAPLAVIVLQFVVSISGMLLEQQRNETALLRSRGASAAQVVGQHLLELLLLGALAIALAPLLGTLLASAMGHADGFLTFGGAALPIRLSSEAYLYAGAAVLCGIAATALPVVGASKQTIVTHKGEVARSLRPPLVQRLYLDLLPLPLAGYAYLQLSERRSLLPVGEAGDAFADPLLLLAPAVALVAATLLLLRLLPLALRLLERLARPLAGAPLLLTLRHLARQPHGQSGLVLMLCLTTALGAYSASAAKTIDRNGAEAASYRLGADLQVNESGAFDSESGEWTLLPVGEHLGAPGVLGAARVLRTQATERLGSRANEVTVLAVDPIELTGVAAWRADYSDQSLSGLLGKLVEDDAAVLVDRRFLEAQRLQIGDGLALTIKDQTVDFVVAGALDYFPTLYPEDGPFFVVGLDYLFNQTVPVPYDVWLRLAPDADPNAVVAGLGERGLAVTGSRTLRDALAGDRGDPTRRGVFGLLGVGFLIAALLTALGLAINSYLSFRRRLVEVGILRSLGLDRRQLTALFLGEQALLVGGGLAAGAAVGLGVSQLFVPFLQVQATEHATTPPFVVVLAVGDLAWLCLGLAALLALTLPLSLVLLGRIRLHEAVKLGEEQG